MVDNPAAIVPSPPPDGPARRGRPKGSTLTHYSTKKHKAIVDAVKQGLPLAAAASLVRVNPTTVQNWVYRGELEDADPKWSKFAADIRQAQAEYKLKLLASIRDIGESTNQWAALMTILERVYPEEFKRPSEKSQVTVNVGLFDRKVHEVTAEAEVYEGG